VPNTAAFVAWPTWPSDPTAASNGPAPVWPLPGPVPEHRAPEPRTSTLPDSESPAAPPLHHRAAAAASTNRRRVRAVSRLSAIRHRLGSTSKERALQPAGMRAEPPPGPRRHHVETNPRAPAERAWHRPADPPTPVEGASLGVTPWWRREQPERALAISEAALGSDHPTVATWRNNLGSVLHVIESGRQVRRASDSAGNGRSGQRKRLFAPRIRRAAFKAVCRCSTCLVSVGMQPQERGRVVRPVASSAAGWWRSMDRPAGSEPELC
jgi:hypothetical protein